MCDQNNHDCHCGYSRHHNSNQNFAAELLKTVAARCVGHQPRLVCQTLRDQCHGKNGNQNSTPYNFLCHARLLVLNSASPIAE